VDSYIESVSLRCAKFEALIMQKTLLCTGDRFLAVDGLFTSLKRQEAK
jgi:hypothetical protein